MNVTDAQMQALREFNQLDKALSDRMEVKGFVKNTSIAIHQILELDHPRKEDFIQLEMGVPGITQAIAGAMGYDLQTFYQELEKGLTLDERVKSVLRSIQEELPSLV